MADVIPILDTHQHLVYANKWPYTWTAGIPALARRSYLYEDYLKAIAGTGITASIFMETTPDDPHWPEEAGFVCKLSRQESSSIRGVIANCRPEAAGFEAYIESIRDDRLVGCRRILHVEPDELSRTPGFAANIRLLGTMNLTFDLCVFPKQTALVIDLVRQCPNVQFILDHCGNPDIAAGEAAIKLWQQGVRAIAALPNVACKISGIAANCKPGTVTADLLRPYVEYCLESFGWDRVVWGSDWPVCLTRCSLADWATCTRQIVAGQDVANQRRLFSENAVRIYRLDARAG